MSSFESSVSQAVREKLLGNDQNSTQILNDAEDQMRISYEEIFRTSSGFDYLNRFEEVGNRIVEEAFEIKLTDPIDNEIGIFCESFMSSIQSFRKKRMILIGRAPFCNVLFPEFEASTSRLHAILVLVPEKQKYVVVDVGSLHGISTKARSDATQPLEFSKMHKRNVMIFDEAEVVHLKMGETKVLINPKICAICLSLPRQVTLSCGHFVCCKACTASIQSCPICRATIERAISNDVIEQTYQKI